MASVNDITAHTHRDLELAGCTQNLDPARDAQICENAQKFHEPAVHSSGFSSLVTAAVTKTQQSVEIVAAPCHEHQQRCAEKYRILNLRAGRDQFTFLGYQKASFLAEIYSVVRPALCLIDLELPRVGSAVTVAGTTN